MTGLFEELCDFAKKRNILLNVELKTGVVYYPGIEEKVAGLVKEYGMEEKVIFSSFNPLSLIVMKRLLPECGSGLLFAKGIDPRHISFIAKKSGLDFLHPDFNIMDDEMVREAKECGLGINAWTVNSEDELDKLIEWRAEGTITNRPDMCLRKLGRK
ncbi:MAG: glycerophosphodiester phosphodiesterase family protein [Candidatus Ornithospirochaeta sp.]